MGVALARSLLLTIASNPARSAIITIYTIAPSHPQNYSRFPPSPIPSASSTLRLIPSASSTWASQDSNKRQIYDDYGADGLKMGGGAPPPGGGFGGAGGAPGGFSFSSSSFPQGGRGGGFTASDPNDIFASIFSSMGGGMGGGSPFGGMGGKGGGGSPFGMGGGGGASPFGGMGGGVPGGFGPMDTDSDDGHGHGHPKPADIVKQLPVSLEDLYKGTTKKLRVTKKRRAGGEEANTLESES